MSATFREMSEKEMPLGSATRRIMSRVARLTAGPGALLVLALMLGSGFAAAGASSYSASHVAAPSAPVAPLHAGAPLSPGTLGSGAIHVPRTTSGTSVPLSPTPAAGSSSSGRAAFFTTAAIPNPPPVTASTLYSTDTFNATNEPSLNLTSEGLMAVAYTAYTSNSPCPGMTANATTEVGFSTSKDLGKNWSAPVYLGNPVCTGYDANFSSAMQPSLTSLANGTLVLAYDEYNGTPGTTYPYYYYASVPPNVWCGSINFDRIVLSESYDNGTTWTTPTVMSPVTNDSNATCPTAGFPDLQPWVTASGNSVYVTWMSDYTFGTYDVCPWNYPSYTAPSSQIDFQSSLDGGATWSNITVMQSYPGSFAYGCYTTAGYIYTDTAAINPTVLVSPTGEVFVAYLSALSDNSYPLYDHTGHMILASSTDNGTTWNYNFPNNNSELQWSNCCAYPDTYTEPMPYLAYSDLNDQLFLAYSGGIYGYFCYNYGYYNYCGDQFTSTVFIQNSSDNGVTWSQPSQPFPTLVDNLSATGFPASELYNPSIAVDSLGILHVQASYVNDSMCFTVPYAGGNSSFCNGHAQVYTNSSDNGSTYTDPVQVYYLIGVFFDYGPYRDNMYSGQYSTMVAAGTQVYMAWTTEQCPGWATGTFCYWDGPNGYAEVMISQPYHGVGVTVTFRPGGLPAGDTFTANLMGANRVTSAPGVVSVSGVPPGQLVSYTIPWVNQSWGIAYSDTISPTSPASFSKDSTVYANYTELVKFTVESNPYVSQQDWQYGYVNYQMTPLPGSSWVTINSTQKITLTPTPATSCYPCSNLSFLSWTGSGQGNVTTLSPNITVIPSGPVNETANFRVVGWCFYSFFTGGNVCLNNSYYPMDFVQSGLPDGVTWGVTIVNPNGSIYYNSTSGNVNGFLVPDGPVSFYVWTIPDSATGDVWVPTTDVQSPGLEPQIALIHVTFTKEAASAASFATRVIEQGLPAGTAWSVELNGQSYGVQANNTSLMLPGGGPYSVNGSVVYLTDGYGYYATQVSESDYVMNSTTQTLTAPASVYLNGTTVLTIEYKPLYLVSTAATTGGTVTPATGWIRAGVSVDLNATADAGYHFVGWTGTGPGSTTVAQSGTPNPTITPTGPVTEFATFRPNPALTWNLTISASGLPTGTAYTVSIGGNAYSSTATFTVGEIVNGSYAIQVPYVYLNSTDTTRFVPSSVTSSLAFMPGSVLEIDENGSLSITYTTQYLVQVTVTPAVGGTVTPSAGAYWENQSTSIDLTAAPAAGYLFLGWNSSTTTGVVSTNPSVTLNVLGPVVETAQFAARPPQPPQTFWVSVSEQGLPTGVTWNISFDAFGASGTNGTLTIFGLNGSYLVNAPAVYLSAGTRYVSNVTNISVQVSQNSTSLVMVQYHAQYLVSVSASAGGNATPSSSWVDKDGSVTLTATPATGYQFANWTGSGPNAQSGATASITIGDVTGPISEVATFTPIYKQTTTTQSSNEGMPLALGLLVGLLIVGLVVGLVVGRMRRGGRSGEASAPPAETTYGEPAAGTEDTPT